MEIKLFCYKDSFYDENLKDLVDCPQCNSTGRSRVSYVDEWGIEKFTDLECEGCMTKRRMLYSLKKSSLFKIAKQCRFDNYIVTQSWQQNVLDKAKQFCSPNCTANCFFIGGCTGAGKTHIATAIVTAMAEQGLEVEYHVSHDILTHLNQIVREDAGLFNYTIEKLGQVDCLYLDDLLKVIPNDKATTVDKLFRVINARYNEAKGDKRCVTVISSERTFTELLDFDSAIAGRIYEMTQSGKFLLNIPKSDTNNYRLKAIK